MESYSSSSAVESGYNSLVRTSADLEIGGVFWSWGVRRSADFKIGGLLTLTSLPRPTIHFLKSADLKKLGSPFHRIGAF